MKMPPPKISIVTPSYNQAEFLEDAIESVLGQRYPNLEYVVIDGGSTDGSVDIIRRHADRLSYWVSEADKGQYEAINKGFEKTSGEIMAWLNSDDKFTPWAFSVVAEIFSSFPEVQWVTTVQPLSWNRQGQASTIMFNGGFNRASFLKGGNLPTKGSFGRRFIQQESTFWRRSLWEQAGGRVETSVALAGDFELWARFYRHTELYGVLTPLGGFRAHGNQKSVLQGEAYVEEAARVLSQYNGRPCRGPEALLRGMLWKVGRHMSLKPLPWWLRGILHRSGLTFPTKVFAWTGQKWEIISGFVV
jgi:glycosyltransferase involved in cell wall biosynthesis